MLACTLVFFGVCVTFMPFEFVADKILSGQWDALTRADLAYSILSALGMPLYIAVLSLLAYFSRRIPGESAKLLAHAIWWTLCLGCTSTALSYALAPHRAFELSLMAKHISLAVAPACLLYRSGPLRLEALEQLEPGAARRVKALVLIQSVATLVFLSLMVLCACIWHFRGVTGFGLSADLVVLGLSALSARGLFKMKMWATLPSLLMGIMSVTYALVIIGDELPTSSLAAALAGLTLLGPLLVPGMMLLTLSAWVFKTVSDHTSSSPRSEPALDQTHHVAFEFAAPEGATECMVLEPAECAAPSVSVHSER